MIEPVVDLSIDASCWWRKSCCSQLVNSLSPVAQPNQGVSCYTYHTVGFVYIGQIHFEEIVPTHIMLGGHKLEVSVGWKRDIFVHAECNHDNCVAIQQLNWICIGQN